ncbi:MAG: DUF5681 domain-containing protein [Alphaproteobacteria bacterium]
MRDKNGRFLPGISGNPSGRPPEVGNVRELAREYTEEAIETLVDLIGHARSDAARGAAAQALLDRGYRQVRGGRPGRGGRWPGPPRGTA